MNVRNKEDTMRDIGAVVGSVGETVGKEGEKGMTGSDYEIGRGLPQGCVTGPTGTADEIKGFAPVHDRMPEGTPMAATAIRHSEFEFTKRADGLLVIRWRRARETSVCRDRSWVARITGLDAKYGLGRSFLSPSDVAGYRVALIEPGTYEYRGVYAYDGQSNCSYNKHGGDHGFFILHLDGKVEETAKVEVMAKLVTLAGKAAELERQDGVVK